MTEKQLKIFLTGRLILPCGETMYGSSMAASVCNRQNVTGVSMAFCGRKESFDMTKE